MVTLDGPVSARPTLSLTQLEAFDPDASAGRSQRRFACPLCDDRPRAGDRRALVVDVQTGLWYCHRCEARGRLREYREDRLRRTRREAVRANLRRAFSVLPAPPPVPDPNSAAWRVWFAAALPLAGTAGERHLAGRDIPLALATAAGARYVPDWYGRPGVAYPLRDRTGGLVAVSVRYVDGSATPKTRTGGRLKLGIFATPGAFDSVVVVLVEGPADALSLAACGIPAVALHHTGWPDWLPVRLAFRRVAIALDADRKGDEASETLLGALASLGARPFRLRPRANDWNEQLQDAGAAALRRYVFNGLASRAWADARRAGQRAPHAALEAAIDAADWQAFCRELPAYESRFAAALPANQLMRVLESGIAG